MGTYAYRTFIAGVILLIVIVIGALWYSRSSMNAIDIIATTTPDYTVATSTTVKIALLDPAGTTNGKSRGCDKVVLVDRTVPSTTAPLAAALNDLFSISTTSVSGWYNFIDKTNETLKFDHVTIASSTANVYLTGKLSGLAGVCDDPRAQIQIEETALQFSSVKVVKIFLNGVEANITPSGRG